MSESPKQRATDKVLRPSVAVRLVESFGARIEVKLPPYEAAQFVKFAKAKQHKVTRVIGALVNEFLPSVDQRERDGYVQPQVPKGLRDRFKSVARQRGLGGGAAYLRAYLERWINPKTGKRRRRGGRSLRPRRSQEFATRGRELIMAAQGGTGGESVARYSFDARNSKVGLMNLTRAMNLSISEFFSALMERACTDWES